MRILHLVGRSHHRGAELFALELASELDAYGHTSELLAVGPGRDGGTEAELETIVDAVDHSPLVLARAALRLRRRLRRQGVDVVLAHGGSGLQVVCLASLGLARRDRPAIVYQLIMGMPVDERGRIWARWLRHILNRSAAVVSLTDALSAEVRGLGYRGPIRLVANARISDRFTAVDRAEATSTLRSEIGVATSTALLGFVGHLVEQKRPDVAVEVVRLLVAMGLDVHLVVVGDGVLAVDLREQIRRDGLGDVVTLLGHRDDVEHVLGGVDLVLLTSSSEGMPGVAIEAQMAGCPVVSFPVGGVSEVVCHGETGVVLQSHDPAAMADEVRRLLHDQPTLALMGKEARERSERFTMSRAGLAYHEVLTAVGRETADNRER